MKNFLLLVSALFTINSIQAQTVTTLAGSSSGYVDETGTAAQFNSPQGVATDASGNVYVADTNNNVIRKITPTGVVTTLAGSTAGFADGTGVAAKFSNPTGVATDASGNVYVADSFNNKIRKITPAGVVTTFAGSSSGYVDGTGTAAQFKVPTAVAIDPSGNVYVTDSYNQKIRKITASGEVSTLAGSTAGDADGTATEAKFSYPKGIATDASGNVYVIDSNSQKIKKIATNGDVTTLAGSTSGYADGTGTAAQFKNPSGIATDKLGNIYVGDLANNRIRKITAIGVVTTIAGSVSSYADGVGTAALFKSPYGVATDASGNVYVADFGNNKIRKISGVFLGINKNTASFGFTIYPNPTSDFLTIQLDDFDTTTQMSIVDVLGKTVLSQNIVNILTTINITNFPKGFYFLTIQNGGKITTKKIVIQ